MSEHVIVTLQDRVLELQLARADKKNALTVSMYSALADAIDSAQSQTEVRALLIHGDRNGFSAGNDVADFLKNPPLDPEQSPVMRFMRALSRCTKPVVAAVNGPAVGIGTTLLLHCDLVYAGHGARFQMPFVNIGLCPEFASSFLVPALIGPQRAAELLLLGEVFDASTAASYGLVNQVLSDDEVLEYARSRAAKLAQQPPNALRTAKSLLKRAQSAAVDEAIKLEVEEFIPLLSKPEAREAMTAFMQKRKPDFSGFD